MKKIFAILLILAIIAAILFFLVFPHFGLFGFGKGKDSGTGQEGKAESSQVSEESSSAESSEESSEDESSEEESSAVVTTVEEKIYVEVTVKEDGYLYQNGSIELDVLKEELQKLEGITVRITDENASKNAYDALIALLKELDIHYEQAEA